MPAYVLVVVLTVLEAVWAAFLVPLRVGGVLVPVSLVLAGPVTALLGRWGGRLLGRPGAAGVGAAWLLVALLAGSRRSEGDLVVPGGGGTLGTLGLLFLVVGAIGAAAGLGLTPPRARAPRD